ncbi:phosphoglycolate phosphatase, bacterial [Polymorphobacter multimanifer]|uniref:Phosphoglycolate phosphatase n=1 Tax=Polymorphobacter multimanifer TaxID=1070431 RepID=A0A841LH53_9SPHN|nr:HAD family hydrolase [Polymorphobacter multimanifer]MBB6228298.1 phosphoglycolate phosphatase [Polymorphobacter multimanifer]GGI86205.1 phosphoglycolate phosphatase, bacterial [Polymorphobacter multimanifer]
MASAAPIPAEITGLLFDLDGTLVNSSRLTCAIIDAMLADRGIAVVADPAVVRAMDGIGGEAMLAAVMGPHCTDPAAEIAAFRARHAVVATPPDLAFPGVAEGLARLQAAGVVMGICSNKPQPLCDKILQDLGLAGRFRAIIGASAGRPRKPAAHTALLALQAMGADVQRTLYVGDTMVDVGTAAAAGLPIALMAWGYGVDAARAGVPQAPLFADMQALLDFVLSRPAGPLHQDTDSC